MVEIEKPRIECVENPGDGSYGKYVVEPLERGYGTTLGNSLRRILLSSLPGTAVTSIKIAGVQHEFSTIPGVKEDVTEIVLNVKSIIAKLHSEGVKTVYIEASGECEVTAGDIKADGEVEVLNPELHIATLGPDASLNMELTLSHGRGYVPADRNKPAQTIIGLIPVDSIYTPVRKVNYTVENTRVGDATDYDKLTFQEVVAELPAGKLERGEDHRLAALRELEEEVGASCGRLTYLGCLYSSPGFSSEVLHMYLAQELTEGACHPDEDEFLSVERIPFSALVEQVRQGEIKDAKTVALVLKAKLLGL